MSQVMSLYSFWRHAQESSPQGRGRPIKWTPDVVAAFWDEYREMQSWFQKTHARQPYSDKELFEVYGAHLARLAGIENSWKVALEIRRTSKALRNRLGKLR